MKENFSPAGVENFNFFSTLVTVFEPSGQFLNYLAGVDPIIKNLENSKKSDFGNASVVNGWRIENPHLRAEFKALNLHLQATLGSLPLVINLANQNLSLSLETWLNVHDARGHNKIHHHGTSFLSGVVYLKIPEGSGKLRLKDPRAGRFFSNHFYDNSPGEVSIMPREGMTVVFPGFLEHYVETSSCKSLLDKRVSIAFNLSVAN